MKKRECPLGSLKKRSPDFLALPHEFDHHSECFLGALNDPVLTDVASLVFFLNTISPVIAILASLAMLAPLLIHLAVEGRDSGRRILGDFFSVQNQFCQSS